MGVLGLKARYGLIFSAVHVFPPSVLLRPPGFARGKGTPAYTVFGSDPSTPIATAPARPGICCVHVTPPSALRKMPLLEAM